MAGRTSLLEVVGGLPGTNCGDCGDPSCTAFASRLLDRSADVTDCPPLEKEGNEEKRKRLVDLLTPPVREVVVGRGDSAVRIGGKEVLHRHELKFHNPTAIAVDVSDTMEPEEIRERCRRVEGFEIEKMGNTYSLDLVAVRNGSGDPEQFAEAASATSASTDYPLILCSHDPAALESGLDRVGKERPLLYAATEGNWRQVADLALQNDCPLVASHPDPATLKGLATRLTEHGLQDVVLDPGTGVGNSLADTLSTFTMLRRAAFEDDGLGHPLLGVPAVAHMEDRTPQGRAFEEAYVAAMLVARYADCLVLHSAEPWSLLGLLNLRMSVYQDPQQPAEAEPGYLAIDDPGPDDPVVVTSNFAMTKSTVENDVKGETPVHLLVADSGGYSVDVGVAADYFTEEEVQEALDDADMEDRVNHRRIVIPGKAARLRGAIEGETGWEVLVGPQDSGDLPGFIGEEW